MSFMVLLQLPIVVDKATPAPEASECQEVGSPKNEPGKRSSWRSWRVWAAGFNLATLYVIRFGVEGWIATWLSEEQGACLGGGEFIFFYQCGGLAGTLLAGFASDWLRGRPLPVAVVSAGILLAATGAMHLQLVAGSGQIACLAAMIGTGVFGQRVLVNLFTRMQVPQNECGKADAIVNGLGELGGVMAGLPFIQIVHWYESWQAYTAILVAMASYLVASNVFLLLVAATVPGASHAKKRQ